MIGLNRYFVLSTKPHQTGKIIIWATTRIKLEQTLKMSLIIHFFTYNKINIQIYKKRLAMFDTDTPVYFLFINNRSELEKLKPTEYTAVL